MSSVHRYNGIQSFLFMFMIVFIGVIYKTSYPYMYLIFKTNNKGHYALWYKNNRIYAKIIWLENNIQINLHTLMC